MAAQAAPRRGEPGFATAARQRGGDPRLRAVGEPATPPGMPETPEAPGGRQAPAQRRQRAARSRQGSGRRAVFAPSTRPLVSTAGLSVDDGAGFLLGIFAWVITMQVIQGGPAQAKQWLKAKFLNKAPDGSWLP